MNDTEPNDDAPKEPETHERGTRLHQISEPDLAELERILPWMYECMGFEVKKEVRTRMRIRRVMEIMSAVRWGYAPHIPIAIIPANDDTPPEAHP